MKKYLITICLVLFLVWPVSVMAGCGDEEKYPRPGIETTWRHYYGANEEPNLPGLPKLSTTWSGPNWITVIDANYITASAIAQRNNRSVSDLRIVIPPDCNLRPVTDLGDPAKVVFRYIELKAVAPQSSIGQTYPGLLTVMGENTITKTVTIKPTALQVLFFVEDCNN